MDPSSGGAGGGNQGRCRIKSAGVHVAGLEAEDCLCVEVRQRVGTHTALAVDWNPDHSLAAQAEQAQGFHYGGMSLLPNQHRDGRGAEQTVGLDIPAGAGQQGVAGGGKCGEIGHGGSGDDGAAGSRGQAKQLAHPFESNLFQGDGGGRLHKERGVLIPGAHHPRRGQRHGQAAAVHKAEEAAVILGHRGGGAVFMEQMEHGLRTGGSRRQRAAQGTQGGHTLICGCYRPLVHGL